MYSRNADDNGHVGFLVMIIPSINAFTVSPHSAAISRSISQNAGSRRRLVHLPLMFTDRGGVRVEGRRVLGGSKYICDLVIGARMSRAGALNSTGLT